VKNGGVNAPETSECGAVLES